MDDLQSVLDLAEQVANVAREHGVETVVIGAYALAVHNVVRASDDIDLGSAVPLDRLGDVRRALDARGLHTRMQYPDEQDQLGGVLVVWNRVDEDGEPLEPVEVVNFINPYRPRQSPVGSAIRHAIAMTEKPGLRYPRLADLIALKLDAGGMRDLADVLELLVHNPDADLDAIRAACLPYSAKLDELIAEARRR